MSNLKNTKPITVGVGGPPGDKAVNLIWHVSVSREVSIKDGPGGHFVLVTFTPGFAKALIEALDEKRADILRLAAEEE